jgi:hypothetical protein
MILTALRSPQLGQPPALTAAYAATVRSLIAVIATLNQQVSRLQGQVEAHFGQHPGACRADPAVVRLRSPCVARACCVVAGV